MSGVPGQPSYEADLSILQKTNELFYKAIENGDMDLMEEVWVGTADAVGATCIHPGQPAIHGLNKVLRSWAVVCARINYMQYFITDVNVRILDQVAIVTCVENVLSDLPGEDPEVAAFGGSHYEAVNIYRKTEAARWRLLTHSSSIVFPASDPVDTDGRPG
ncbi:MAG TPA: nuclear transport factor 2 family protein [Actinospica sp.]|jgi:hypothetical protein|nr:nuclear transport factor 2 family protein [Actinospica sp.]